MRDRSLYLMDISRLDEIVASSSKACSRKNQPSHFGRQHDITSRTGSCVKRRRNFNRPWHLA